MDHEEFLKMAEVYKDVPCPVCHSPNLIYNGYTFFDGSLAGQLQMSCEGCQNDFDLHVHSMKSSGNLQ